MKIFFVALASLFASCSIKLNTDGYNGLTSVEKTILARPKTGIESTLNEFDLSSFRNDTIGRKVLYIFSPSQSNDVEKLGPQLRELAINMRKSNSNLYLVMPDYNLGKLYAMSRFLEQPIFIIPNSEYGSNLAKKRKEFLYRLTGSTSKFSGFGFLDGKLLITSNQLNEFLNF